jgi:hypothetical protein
MHTRNPMKPTYLKPAAVRKLIKAHGKRTSADFLAALDRYVHDKLLQAVGTHNGGKRTLDSGVAAYVFGKR